jgi:hypothetical protein
MSRPRVVDSGPECSGDPSEYFIGQIVECLIGIWDGCIVTSDCSVSAGELEYRLVSLVPHRDKASVVFQACESIQQEEGMTMAYQATHEAMCDQELIYELQARRKFQLDQTSNLHAAREEGRSNTIRRAGRPLQEQGLSLEAITSFFSVTQAELGQILSQKESNLDIYVSKVGFGSVMY